MADKITASDYEMNAEDYQTIVDGMGRAPNELESLCYSLLWSEGNTQKVSKSLVNDLFSRSDFSRRRAGAVELDEKRSLVISMADGAGEERRLTNIAAGNALASVLSDFLDFAASPLEISAAMQLGAPELVKTSRNFRSLTEGLSDRSNMLGIPLGSTELYFEKTYKLNPMLQLFGVGIRTKRAEPAEDNHIEHRSPLVYLGPPTSRDGLSLGGPIKGYRSDLKYRSSLSRPQVSNVFLFDRLSRAIGGIRDIVDGFVVLREGGLIAGLHHLSDELGVGLRLNLDVVPCEDESLSSRDRLLSQTPFRILLVVKKENHRTLTDTLRRFHLSPTTVGEVTPGDDLELRWFHNEVAAIPIKHVKDGFKPLGYSLISSPPMLKDRGKKRQIGREPDSSSLADLSKLGAPNELSDTWADILANPNLSARSLPESFFDREAGALTLSNGGGANVYRIDDNYTLATALSSMSRYFQDDPYLSTAHAVARAIRDLAAVGAEARGLCFHMTFGDCSQYSEISRVQESLRAIRDSAKVLDIPILADNVQTGHGGKGEFLPVCTVGGIGVIGHYRSLPTVFFQTQGDSIFLVGRQVHELGASEYLSYVHRINNALVPDIDYRYEKKLCEVIRSLANANLLVSAHDISDGGLALALTQASVLGGRALGMTLELEEPKESLPGHVLIFSEAPSRFLISCKEERRSEVIDMLSENNISILGKGLVGGKRIIVKGAADCALAVDTAKRIWRGGLNYLIGAEE